MDNQRKHCQQKRRPRILIMSIAIVALLIGIWLVISPEVEQQRALHEQSRLLESIEAGDGIIVLDPHVERVEYNFYIQPEDEALSSETSPSPISSMAEPDAEPTQITGIGILSIGKIDLRLPVVDGVSKSKLKVAVGRVPQTAEIGAIGNAVIAGHRSYTYGQYFNRLGELEKGDIITYQPKDGEAMRFEVYEIRTILPGDNSVFQQPDSFPEITLYTCTPIRIASHRLLIQARLITN